MIKNNTKHTLIAKNFQLCTTLLSKAKGLMFSRKKNHKNLVFVFDEEKKIPLHMFFVFYPIDIVYLDLNNKVVELKENFLPFTYYNPKQNAKYVLELEKGTIRKAKIKEKDQIMF